MLALLRNASRFTYNRKSTLNITDTVQTTFRSLFFDFLLYMFAKMNEDHSLDILLDKYIMPHAQQLFLSLLRDVPVPDLQVLSTNVILQPPKKCNYRPKLPFFKYVSETVDKYIDESREKVNQGAWPTLLQGKSDQLQGGTYTEASIRKAPTPLNYSTSDAHKSKKFMEERYCEVVKSRIKVCMVML